MTGEKILVKVKGTKQRAPMQQSEWLKKEIGV